MEQKSLEQRELAHIKRKLDSVSPSMCLAKWMQVSLHLTTGRTHSCYHPPAHSIDPAELLKDPSALHNTKQKKEERALMLKGERPEGCSYCWSIEDSGNHYSDRHYRSLEPWAEKNFQEVLQKGCDSPIIPSYMEVNFNPACQFKCSYCSPHLSTTWMEEIKRHGAYPTIVPHNDIENLKKMSLWPISSKEDNPYVEAFWKWWPELYPRLRVFRMTGGEPLIDPNTYRVLEYIRFHPHPELELAITSNLCPPEKMMNRFQSELRGILKDRKIARFMLFPSIDGWGRQAEYIRFGLDIREFEKNVRSLIKNIPETLISFIVTVNALSPFSLEDLLDRILEWQKEAFYLYKGNYRRVFFDLPYLRAPAWQALNILPEGMAGSYFKRGLDFMEKNKVNLPKGKPYGFSDFQINKMRRLIDLSNKTPDQKQLEINRINFYKFFSEHDRRRQTDFVEAFPELKLFWRSCRALSKKWDRAQEKARLKTARLEAKKKARSRQSG